MALSNRRNRIADGWRCGGSVRDASCEDVGYVSPTRQARGKRAKLSLSQDGWEAKVDEAEMYKQWRSWSQPCAAQEEQDVDVATLASGHDRP
jgi:hypothetical protein